MEEGRGGGREGAATDERFGDRGEGTRSTGPDTAPQELQAAPTCRLRRSEREEVAEVSCSSESLREEANSPRLSSELLLSSSSGNKAAKRAREGQNDSVVGRDNTHRKKG